MNARAPIPWAVILTVIVTFGLPLARPIFAYMFPELPRPLYEEDPFWLLLLDHLGLVAVSGAISVLGGIALAIAVTRPWGADFRSLVETLAAMGQTFPPVAVLAVAVPALGFGIWPAIIALTLYGLLPVTENTVAGLSQIAPAIKEAARGSGMTPWCSNLNHHQRGHRSHRLDRRRQVARPSHHRRPQCLQHSLCAAGRIAHRLTRLGAGSALRTSQLARAALEIRCNGGCAMNSYPVASTDLDHQLAEICAAEQAKERFWCILESLDNVLAVFDLA